MAALDYYELLEVAHLRGASFDADELKRAYRRLALQWHPDKHAAAGAAEQLRATEHFKLIQNAYAVLGDDAERAWYDTHAGVAPGASEVAAGLVNIFALFSQAAYDGFADGDARGFYCVYAAAFASIVAEEAKYADAAAGTGGGPAPPLGDSRTQPGEVSAFYAFWGGFSSRMHFGWADEHDPREGRNRAERRFMEKENEALRRAARRARSEDVRALADFVRKRDKRVILQQIEAQRKAEEAEARRRATLAAAAAAAAELRAGQAAADRERLAAREAEISASGHFRLADFDNGDEAGDASRARGNRRRRGAPPSGEGGGESAVPRTVVIRGVVPSALAPADAADDDGSGADSVDELFVCDLCHKTFKSLPSLQTHESSRKHRAALAAILAEQMPLAGDGAAEPSSGEGEANARSQRGAGSVVGTERESRSPTRAPRDNGLAAGGGVYDAGCTSDNERGAPAAPQESRGSVKVRLNKTELRRLRKREEAVSRIDPGPPGDPAAELGELGVKGFISKLGSIELAGGARGRPMAAIAYAQTVAKNMAGGLVCEACREIFDTRNALFAHIKLTGHNAVKDGRDLVDEVDSRGLSGGGGSGGKAAAKKLRARAKNV